MRHAVPLHVYNTVVYLPARITVHIHGRNISHSPAHCILLYAQDMLMLHQLYRTVINKLVIRMPRAARLHCFGLGAKHFKINHQ